MASYADASLDATREEFGDPVAMVRRTEKDRLSRRTRILIVRNELPGALQVLDYDRVQERLVERPEARSMAAIEFSMYVWSSPERRRILRRPSSFFPPPEHAAAWPSINLDLFPADRENRVALIRSASVTNSQAPPASSSMTGMRSTFSFHRSFARRCRTPIEPACGSRCAR